MIPHKLVAVLTSPGIVMHEISHRFMCDFFKVPVYEVKYFEAWSRTAGFVRYEKTNNVVHAFWIGISPLLINSILCMILTFPCSSSMYFTGTTLNVFSMILWWIGISMGVNSIPSNQDLSSITKDRVCSNAVLGLCGFLQVINDADSAYFVGFIYTYLLATALPRLIFYSYS